MSTAFPSPETIEPHIRTFELRFTPTRRAVLEFPHPSAKGPRKEALIRPGFIRGVRFALAIEALGALLIYVVWQASHLLRVQ
jgi:hypothetical protein